MVHGKRQGAARNPIGGFEGCAMGLASAMGRACRKSALSSRYWKSVEAIAGSAHCLSAAGKGRKRGTPCLMITCSARCFQSVRLDSTATGTGGLSRPSQGAPPLLDWCRERAEPWHPCFTITCSMLLLIWERCLAEALQWGPFQALAGGGFAGGERPLSDCTPG